MSSDIGWHFPEDESDQWDGFNVPGIEHFRGSPVLHLAREVNQNSLDAAEKNPVVVEFNRTEVPVSKFPNLESYRSILSACRQAADTESEKAKSFFNRAEGFLSKGKIPVLAITDWNAHGLAGPCVNGTPYYAFMKAEGQSRKESSTAGGSYGIGKYAPYAVSQFRTIFVTTVYRDSAGTAERLTQGKSVLMSHDISGRRHRGVGFWGVKDKCKPIEGNEDNLPSWLIPSKNENDEHPETGTTLSVVGFSGDPGWENMLCAAVAENFFGAVADGKLVVKIGNDVRIDEGTIHHVFDNSEYRKAIVDETDEPERFDDAALYLRAHSDKVESITVETENIDLGFCRLKVLLCEEAPKKVAVLRNGMFITDQLDGLKRFGEFKEFVAVVECLSDKGKSLLREMEPPRHDAFEPMRLLDSKRQKQGKRALKELSRWVREMLKRHAKDPVSEVTSIDELSQYFGDEDPEGSGDDGHEVNPQGEVVVRAKPVPRKAVLGRPERGIDTEGSGDEEGEQGGRGDGTGHASDGGAGDGNSGGSATREMPVALANVRGLPRQDGTWKIAFTPATSGKIRVVIEEAGADTVFPVSVVESSLGQIENGSVVVPVDSDSRVEFDISLSERFRGALRVTAYEV